MQITIPSEPWEAGQIKITSSLEVPGGWFETDGRDISRKDYAELFNKIGTRYGIGDGATTFALPDINGLYAPLRGLIKY